MKISTLELQQLGRNFSDGVYHSIYRAKRKKCGHEYSFLARCGKRTCSRCRRKDFYRLQHAYADAINHFQSPKLLTLTLKNVAQLTKDEVDRLRGCMKTLFRLLGDRVRGGIYAIEPENSGNGWHIHAHCVIDAVYLPQANLVKIWRELTGDSFIVDIRKAWSPRGALSYILKYLTKAPKISGALSDVYNTVLKGMRLIHAFGHLYRHWRRTRTLVPCRGCQAGSEASRVEKARRSPFTEYFRSHILPLLRRKSLVPAAQQHVPTDSPSSIEISNRTHQATAGVP